MPAIAGLHVVRDEAEHVRRILRPARDADVDFRDRAVPVAVQEDVKSTLDFFRQGAAPVALGELVDGGIAEQPGGFGVLPGELRDAPQFKIHFGGDVVRDSAQQDLHFFRGRRRAQQPREQPAEHEDGQHPRRNPRDARSRNLYQALLRRSQPFASG